VGTRDELLHAASIQGEPALRAPHRINRSLRGWQEIPSYRCDTKGASERRATTRRIDVDAARSKLNRGFHGIRHWLAFVGKTSARKLECGGRTRERGGRGEKGGREAEKKANSVDNKEQSACRWKAVLQWIAARIKLIYRNLARCAIICGKKFSVHVELQS